MGQPPVERVCPRCGRISYAEGRSCPYCGGSFRRPGVGATAALLTVFAVLVLGGMALMLLAAGREAERRLDREAERVERELDNIQREVREELDRRLPTVTPSP